MTSRLTPRLLTAFVVLAGLTGPYAARPASTVAADKPAASGAAFEVYEDKGGEFRWRLRTQNGQVIATSGDGYKEKRSCLAGIESVKKNAADAPVKDDAAAPK